MPPDTQVFNLQQEIQKTLSEILRELSEIKANQANAVLRMDSQSKDISDLQSRVRGLEIAGGSNDLVIKGALALVSIVAAALATYIATNL